LVVWNLAKDDDQLIVIIVMCSLLYYWFGVGEGTLQIHHLNSNFTPTRHGILLILPPPS
jgi:hypothetical protein